MRLINLVFATALCGLLAACAHSAKDSSRSSPQSGPSSVLELTVGQNGTYAWHGRFWQIDELTSTLKSPLAPHVTEVRLLNGPNPSSLQNLIEIGQLANSLGAKALYERNGELKSINIVQ